MCARIARKAFSEFPAIFAITRARGRNASPFVN